MHGRTYKQAFTGKADLTGIYELKQHLGIPVMCNGDVLNYEDGMRKILIPEDCRMKSDALVKSEAIRVKNEHQNETYVSNTASEERSAELKERVFHKSLDGFMIGRASFGNPWCFLPSHYEPTLGEILQTMREHGDLLWQWKERKGMMEARKHLVQYLHGFPGVKEYRGALVHVESREDIARVLDQIQRDHPALLSGKISSYNPESQMAVWECGSD